MPDSISVSEWMTHTLLAGAVLLAVSLLLVRRVKAPIRQERIARWTVQTLLLLAVLSALPTWIPVSIPAWMQGPPAAAEVEDSPRIVYLEAPPEMPAWDLAGQGDVQAIEAAPVPSSPLEIDTTAESETASVPPAPWPLLPTVYLAIAGLFFLRFLLGNVALFRLRRDLKPAPARVTALAAKVPGYSDRIRLAVSERISTPICFGLLRPVVVLPARMASWLSDEELLWILAHECDHIRRGDGWTNFWLGLARCLYFPIPWFWLLPRSSEFAQECLADEAAAKVSGQAADYAAFLVTLTDRSKRVRSASDRMVRVASVLAMRGKKSNLFRRVTMLLEPKRSSDQPSRLWAFLAGGSLVATTVVLSGLGIVQAQEPKTEAKTITIQVISAEDVKELKEAVAKAEKAKQEAIAQLEQARKQLQAQREKLGNDKEADLTARIKAEKILAEKAQGYRILADKLQAEKQKADKVQAENLQRFKILADDATGEKKLFLRINDQDQQAKDRKVVRVEVRHAGNDEEVDRLQKTVQELKKTIELLKDQPEARKSLEKTVKEYEKKIAEAKAKGEIPAAPKAPTPPKAPVPPIAPLAPLANPFGEGITFRMNDSFEFNQQLEKKIELILKEYEKQLAATLKPEARDVLEKAIEAKRKSLENLKMQGALPAVPGNVFRFNAVPFQGMNVQSPDEPSPGRMGLTMTTVPEALVEQLDLPKEKGLLVTQVRKGSPAEKAGVRVNDILLSMNGKDVSIDPNQIAEQTARIPGGKPFAVVVIRKGKKITIADVVLPEVKKAVVVEGKKVINDEAKEGATFTSNFNVISINNGTRYAIEGSMKDGKPVTRKIEIEVDGKTTRYDSLEKVPEEHRAGVKKLLSGVK